jgi:UDP-3-O-[3-hydroxymyristoyl] N-acetylglucosamine deacetylase
VSILTQKTIRKPIHFDGVGLHTGKEVKMNIFPAEPNSGIVFKRIDLNNNNIVIPSVYNVSKASFCTTISNEFGVELSTIEHFM